MVAHVGCIDLIGLDLLKDADTISFTNEDLESVSNLNVKVLPQCNFCQSPNAQECMACCKIKPDFPMRKVTIVGGLFEVEDIRVVHQLCALSLPAVFQFDSYSSFP